MPRKRRRHGTEATKRLRGRAGGRGDGAKKKVGEMDGLAREMGEWSLFDAVGEMSAASKELGRSGVARGFGNRGGDASR